MSREDCAAAVLAGGDEHANKTYDIAGPETLTGADLAALYASVRGAEMEAAAVDDATWPAEAVAHGLAEPAAMGVASFGEAIREGALNQRSGDVEQLTGRKPVSVRQVLTGSMAPTRPRQ